MYNAYCSQDMHSPYRPSMVLASACHSNIIDVHLFRQKEKAWASPRLFCSRKRCIGDSGGTIVQWSSWLLIPLPIKSIYLLLHGIHVLQDAGRMDFSWTHFLPSVPSRSCQDLLPYSLGSKHREIYWRSVASLNISWCPISAYPGGHIASCSCLYVLQVPLRQKHQEIVNETIDKLSVSACDDASVQCIRLGR